MNLAGASCARIAARDRKIIGKSFGKDAQAATAMVPCDILFLYCRFELPDKIAGQSESFRSLIRDSKARVAVVASEIPNDIMSDPAFQRACGSRDYPPVNLVLTNSRNGKHFGTFFKSLFQMMWKGASMPVAYVQLAPQGPKQPKNIPATILMVGAGQVTFAPPKPRSWLRRWLSFP